MTAKSIIIQTIEQMNDTNANFFLDLLKQHLPRLESVDPWDLIPEEEPDEWDLKMLHDIEHNPDCNVFSSEKEMDSRRLSRNTSLATATKKKK